MRMACPGDLRRVSGDARADPVQLQVDDARMRLADECLEDRAVLAGRDATPRGRTTSGRDHDKTGHDCHTKVCRPPRESGLASEFDAISHSAAPDPTPRPRI